MREAANLTATSALQTYEVQSTVRRAFSELVLAVSCMVTSLVLVTMSPRLFSVTYGCAVLTLVQAAFATWRYFRATEVLTKDRCDSSVMGVAEA